MDDITHDRLTYTVTETSRLLRVSRASAYALIHSGALRSVRVNRRILVPHVALQEFLAGSGSTR